MKENVKTFNLINAAALLEQEFEPLRFAVEKILPHGLFILAGSGKIGNYRRNIIIERNRMESV